jgi:hypothetical protein
VGVRGTAEEKELTTSRIANFGENVNYSITNMRRE